MLQTAYVHRKLFIYCGVVFIIAQKQLESAEYFNYLGSMTTNEASYTFEIKSRIAMEKAAFNRRRLISPADWT